MRKKKRRSCVSETDFSAFEKPRKVKTQENNPNACPFTSNSRFLRLII